MKVGGATCTINCELGDDLAGQFHRRFCEAIRDDLEANVLYLEGDDLAVLLVSLDLAGLFDAAYRQQLLTALAAATGVPASRIIITSTHTHEGPDTLGLLPDSPQNERYLARLQQWLGEVCGAAVAAAQPARIGWAQGRAHIGYNRRMCWADGSHTMYGDGARPDFTGLEGPDDPTHTVLYAVAETGGLLAVAQANCCHATCLENTSQASADFPGEARRLIRDALGTKLPVLYLQGASGDTSPWNQLGPEPRYDREQRLHEVGALLAGETLRLLHESAPVADPVFRHARAELELGVRLPSAAELSEAAQVVAAGEEAAGRANWILAQAGVLRLHEEFAAHPVETVTLHALRIGDFALLTNPCELYCQFGHDLRRRSPAGVTALAQLADGFSGYCPTVPALLGGGYSGSAIYWARLEPQAGYKIVETTAQLVNSLWRGE